MDVMDEGCTEYIVLGYLLLRKHAGLSQIMHHTGLHYGEVLCDIVSLMERGFVAEKRGLPWFSRDKGDCEYKITRIGRKYMYAPLIELILGHPFGEKRIYGGGLE